MPGARTVGPNRTPNARIDRAGLTRRAGELHSAARAAAAAFRPSEAMRLLQRALRVLDRVSAGNGDAPGEDQVTVRIRVLVTLAYVEAETRSLEAGLACLDAASDLLPGLPEGAHRLALHGLVRRQHGIMLSRAGQFDEGIAVLDDAVDVIERAEAGGAPDPLGLAQALINRGLTHIGAGHPSPAERDLRGCIDIAAEGRYRANVAGGDHLPVVAAKAHHNLGALALRVGDVPRALRYYEEASSSFRELSPSFLPKLRMDQAEALLAAGLAEEAARHLDEALPEMRRHRDHQNLAEAEVFRAAAALIDNDLALARRLATSARRRFVRRGNRAWAAIAALTRLRAEARTPLRQGRVPQTLPTRALRLATELRRLRLVDESALAAMLAVRMELRRGAVEPAGRLLAQVPAPRRVTPVDHRMLLRLCRAELAVALGDRRRAFAQARAGLAELGRMRDRMGGLELVCGTAVHGRELGELAVRLVLDRSGSAGRAKQLFTWLERTRAQVYRYEPLPPIDDPVLAERVGEYRHLSRALQEARRDGVPVGELTARHAALQREVMRLGWRDGPWGRPRPVAGLAEIAERLGGRALVSFATSGEEIVAVVVVEGRARLVRLGTAAEAVAAASELHADLDALAPDRLPEPLFDAVSGSALRRAERLDTQLLRPLAGIVGDRELVVVPTGALYAVAWGSLPSLRGRPVVVAPSATAWLAAAGPSGSRRPAATRTVLVGGPGLPAAVGEVGRLREHRPDAELIDAGRATVRTVLDALDGAGLAHLAAHGAHEPENALFSRLELTDGALFAHETARLRRPPEHVVLAACELALSRIRPGDEALGFAGALLAAGGRTVTAAVTRVGDEAAAAAMADYHRLLAAGRTPAVALAEATAVDPMRRPFVCLGASG
jgi:tetratricopeptide (TPR) repeat protein